MTPQELISSFIDSLNKSERKFYSIRDNCGPAALALMDYARLINFPKSLERIRGEFEADIVVSEKKDFTPEMKKEYLNDGFNFNDGTQRKQWIENHPTYQNEWRKIPHYWLEDENGIIYDPSGEMQFIKTKFAADLSTKRYQKNDIANTSLQKMPQKFKK